MTAEILEFMKKIQDYSKYAYDNSKLEVIDDWEELIEDYQRSLVAIHEITLKVLENETS